jgi:hypothetical protein
VYDWLGSSWVTRSRWFGSWNAAGGKPVSIVLDLDIGGMHVSFGQFGYRCDSCELMSLSYS